MRNHSFQSSEVRATHDGYEAPSIHVSQGRLQRVIRMQERNLAVNES